MDFKIDTRDSYSVITPDAGELSAILSEELYKVVQNVRQEGGMNVIVDFQHITGMSPKAVDKLLELHAESYDAGCSFVLTAVKGAALAAMKDAEADDMLNIAPQMIEAIDIVSMEILERDLFNEEE